MSEQEPSLKKLEEQIRRQVFTDVIKLLEVMNIGSSKEFAEVIRVLRKNIRALQYGQIKL